MSLDLDSAFVKQFESEVHLSYQRMGSKLGNTVRKKTNVRGESTTFQTVGTGTASQKSRNSDVTPMSLAHAPVECTLADYYAPDYVDKMDELKLNHDERQVVAMSAAAAIGRKQDALIIAAMDGSSNTQVHGSAGMTTTKIDVVTAHFGENDIPDDGQRYAAVSPDSWNDLLGIAQFSSADYVGMDQLPYKGGMTAKNWQGFTWFVHSGLTIDGSNIRNNLFWHRTGVGAASGQELTTEINYVPTKVAWLVNAMMSMGAVLIDDTSVYIVETDES